MKIISHRGNLQGPDKNLENNPKHIKELTENFDVEIDLWCYKNQLFLGHDYPTYEIDISFFNQRMWIHCKNIESIDFMSKTNHHWFWHENDKITITSKGEIWCFPNIYVENGITVMLGLTKEFPNIKGICTDYLNYYI